MKEKRCIFHVPFYIDPNWASGTNIRPLRIIKGLEKSGYTVDVVSGYGKERKGKIQEIKKNIKNGMKYDFCYSESSTEPTLLTEKNHIPTYPLLDFGFLKFLKKNGLKVGLFYRDIYWRFPIYNNVPLLKRTFAKIFYIYDLIKYKNILDVLYLPHKRMINHSPVKMTGVKIEELPPAVDKNRAAKGSDDNSKIKVFYVGGVTGLYDMSELFKAFKRFPQGELVVCCREGEWKGAYSNYKNILGDNIKIIHESGAGKDQYIHESHICSLMFEKSEYRTFAMPLKLFEYISFGKPMISTVGTATGEYIEKNDLGWSLEYNEEEILKKLKEIAENRSILFQKKRNVERIIDDNTWDKRAEKIIEDLTV